MMVWTFVGECIYTFRGVMTLVVDVFGHYATHLHKTKKLAEQNNILDYNTIFTIIRDHRCI